CRRLEQRNSYGFTALECAQAHLAVPAGYFSASAAPEVIVNGHPSTALSGPLLAKIPDKNLLFPETFSTPALSNIQLSTYCQQEDSQTMASAAQIEANRKNA